MIPATKFASTWRAAKPITAAAIAPEASRPRARFEIPVEARERDRDPDQDDHGVQQPAHEAQARGALAREAGLVGDLAGDLAAERAVEARSRSANATRIETPALIQVPVSTANMARQPRAILLDALGTLIGFEPPAPHLQAELHRRGYAVTPDAARRRSARRSPTTARTWTKDATPSRCTTCACAARSAMEPALPGIPRAAILDALLASLRFFAYPDSAPTLLALRERRASGSSWSPTGTGRCTSGWPRPASRRCSTARSRPPRSARPSRTARSSRAALRARRRHARADVARGRHARRGRRGRPRRGDHARLHRA